MGTVSTTGTAMAIDELPDLLYLPGGVQRDGQARLETRTDLATGSPALLAFTSLDRLVDRLGDRQGWTAVTRASFAQLVSTLGVVRVVVDLPGAGERPEWESDAPILRRAAGRG